MGNRKKRQREATRSTLDQVNQFANLTGFNGSASVDALDGCLAEFHQGISAKPFAAPTNATEKNDNTLSPPVSTGNAKAEPDLGGIDLNQVESWNRSFLAWVQGGKYLPGLLPSVEEELSRNFKVQELSSFLLKSGKDLRMPMFERWLLDSKLEDAGRTDSSSVNDPVLPHSAKPDSDASLRLVEELRKNGRLSSTEAEQAVAELCRRSNVAVQELSSQASRFKSQNPLKPGDRIEVQVKKDDGGGEGDDNNETKDGSHLAKDASVLTFLYSRKKWRKPFCFKLNKTHYDKLRQRFITVHNQKGSSTKIVLATTLESNCKATHSFHILILALLLRYSALSGGQLLQDLRGGGMQGAIHEQVFDVLRSTLEGPFREGFASPFNVYLPSFASVFPDIEWHFGSIGNFLNTVFSHGCCEANPPFAPGLMNDMVAHMQDCLANADKHGSSLTFVVIVPTATTGKDGRTSSSKDEVAAVKQAASESFQRMVSSPNCRHHLILDAREHGYIEGSQHLRPTRYKLSVYDTSIVILQSEKALAEALDQTKLDADIAAAFASRHEEEQNHRRKQNEEKIPDGKHFKTTASKATARVTACSANGYKV
jgi:hypothetical protein